MANPTSPPTRARGTYAKTAARRADIVRAGLEVFSVGGYHSASLREIAERVGLSQAGVLHHFANKWELLSAVLALRDEDALRLVQTDRGGLEVIRNLIALVRHNSAVPGLVELQCVLSSEATHADHPAHDYFVDRYRWTTDLVTDAFGDMLTRGELRTGIDPRSAAVVSMAVMDGLQVQWLLDRSAVDMVSEFRRHVQTYCAVEL